MFHSILSSGGKERKKDETGHSSHENLDSWSTLAAERSISKKENNFH